MGIFNTNFNLTVDDIEQIETALQERKKALSVKRLRLLAGENATPSETIELDDLNADLVEIHDLLGRLHNQKVFFRPRAADAAPYVSG
jgi:hypothetical protein